MSLSFKTPKTALNVTTREIQNIGGGDCPEINLESTSVEYTENGEYSVTPSEGFDGLSEVGITVNIDTQAIEDEAYAEGEAAGRMQGYQDGYDAGETIGIENGIAEQKAKLTSLNVTSNGTYNKEDGYNSVTVNVPATDCSVERQNGYDEGYSEGYMAGQADCLPAPTAEYKTVTYTSNGTYSITPDTTDYLSGVDVTVNVPSSASCPDWSTIGWDCNDVAAAGIDADLAYTAQKKAEYEGGTITSFNNNVAPGLKFAPGGITVTYAGGMFQNPSIIFIPMIDTSSCTSMVNMFDTSSISTIPLLDTSNVTSFQNTFSSCKSLKTIPSIDTSSAETFYGMFTASTSIVSVPTLSAANVSNVTNMFGSNNSSTPKSLTTLGGFTNLGKAFTGTNASAHLLNFQYNTVLTKQSIMNVINNLSAPDDATCTDATLKLSATCYALLDASDIAIATAKNWTVTSA